MHIQRLFKLYWERLGGRLSLLSGTKASGRGCGRVAEVVETQVLEARLACEGRLWDEPSRET